MTATHYLFGQNSELTSVLVDKTITPTASVASLGKYGNDSGVDNKGRYNNSIKLFSLSSGNLKYNMNISYSSNGLKVNDWGSRIGLLWNNNFTSVIYRQIRGLPDETGTKLESLQGSPRHYTVNDYHTIENLSQEVGIDGESDLFYYNIFGLTGSFVILNGKAQQVNYNEKLKIDIGTDFSHFIITLQDGTKYYYGTNNNIEYTAFNTLCMEESPATPQLKTAWFLTKMESATGQKNITFSYENIYNSYIEDKSETLTIKNKAYSQDRPCNGHIIPRVYNHNNCTRIKIAQTKNLTKVTSSDFVVDYSYIAREDITSDKLLDNIEIKGSNNILINKIKFDYSKYGNNSSITSLDDVGTPIRYFLQKVSVGKTLEQKYYFTYNNEALLPPRFSYNQDIMGLYNGITNNSNFFPDEFIPKIQALFTIWYPGDWQIPPIPSANRAPHYPESSYGLLTNIQYPTGGNESIIYEPNTIIKNPQNQIESNYYGVRTKKVELWSNDTDRITKEYIYNKAQFDSIENKINFAKVSSLFSDDDNFGGHVTSVYQSGHDPNCAVGEYGIAPFYIDQFYKINSNKRYTTQPFQGDFIAYENVTELINNSKFTTKEYWATEDRSTQTVLGDLSYYTPNSDYYWFANLMFHTYEGEVSANQFLVKRFLDLEYEFKDYKIIKNYTARRDYLPEFFQNDYYYDQNLDAYSVGEYLLPNRWVNTKKRKETLVLKNGQKISKEIVSNYNDITLYNNLKTQTTYFSDHSTSQTNYQYSTEKGNQYLIDKYMVGIPLETQVTKTENGITKIQSNVIINYPSNQSEANANTTGLPLPNFVKSIDLENPTRLNTEATYDQYDNKGNILQYSEKGLKPVTIVWGYNQSQPIAKIEGVKISDIPQSLINTIVSAADTDGQQGTDDSEQTLLTALDAFRSNSNLSNYQITTYSYNPLIGVTSITPPSGIREIYIYDSANRLKEIRQDSATGKLLKTFKYNYKN